MIDIEKLADNAKTEIDNLSAHALKLESDFRRVADLARDLDESNWKERSQEIYEIAYNNY